MKDDSVIESPKFASVEASHVGQWVAVADRTGELLGVAETLHGVLTKTSSTKDKTVFRVLPDAFAGSGSE